MNFLCSLMRRNYGLPTIHHDHVGHINISVIIDEDLYIICNYYFFFTF